MRAAPIYKQQHGRLSDLNSDSGIFASQWDCARPSQWRKRIENAVRKICFFHGYRGERCRAVPGQRTPLLSKVLPAGSCSMAMCA